MQRIRIVDSHTEGEPTRVVVEGGPDLGSGSAAERLEVFRRDHDAFRAAVVLEPRGADCLVGALLGPPSSPDAVAQVIFFNNVGFLGMCVHGTIGVARTLLHLGWIGRGRQRLETPAGTVTFAVSESGVVAVENVLSYRYATGVTVATAHHGEVRGDVAYGGNWFFLFEEDGRTADPEDFDALTEYAWDVRRSLTAAGVTGAGGAEIDHVEVLLPARRPEADARSFVLCPGKVFDRSPCGTGLSAKMACLAASGVLAGGRIWRLESAIGSVFEGSVEIVEGGVLPTVRGRAYVTSEATLLVEPDDPFPYALALDRPEATSSGVAA